MNVRDDNDFGLNLKLLEMNGANNTSIKQGNDRARIESSSMLGEKRKCGNDVRKDNAGVISIEVYGTPKNRHHSLLNVACYLYPSWKDPSVGPPFARLCRIVPNFTSHQLQQQKKQRMMSSPTQQNGFSLEWESIVQLNMETPDDVVMELARWYCSSADSHFLKVNILIANGILLI